MPMTDEQLNQSRDALIEKRSALIRRCERLAQDAAESTEGTVNSKSPLDSADNAADAYDQDFAFMNIESEEQLLRKIDAALQHIRDKTYGDCSECKQVILPERLEYLPWATLCIKCQEREEKRARRRTSAGLDFDLDGDNQDVLNGDDKELG